MRVVVVPAQVPDPEGGAAARTSLAMLRGLLAHGVDVTMVAPRLAGEPETVHRVPGTVVPVEPPSYGGVAGALHRLRSPIGELAETALAAAVATAARDVDVLHLDQIETACLGPHPRTPTVLHLHYRALLDAAPGLPWQPAFRHRMEYAAAERRAVRRYPHLLATADDVARSMTGISGHGDVTVVPLAIDPDDYAVRAPVTEPVLGIIGTATWMPTAAAIRRLLDEVWPRVLARVPDARLLVAGRGTDAFEAPDSSVEIRGTVPSAAGFLAELAALVYPATRGSGAKVKVLEALACGVPVVTSLAGTQGLLESDGLVRADSAEQLANACVELLTDATARAQRGRAARDYIESRHAPLPATAPLVELYERMARRR